MKGINNSSTASWVFMTPAQRAGILDRPLLRLAIRPGDAERPGIAQRHFENVEQLPGHIAPDGDASFIFTFAEAGDFQFADHIGSNGLVLLITVR